MEAIKAALILMKNSHFDRTPQYISTSKVIPLKMLFFPEGGRVWFHEDHGHQRFNRSPGSGCRGRGGRRSQTGYIRRPQVWSLKLLYSHT